MLNQSRITDNSAFQYTLSITQQLSCVPEYKQLLLSTLGRFAIDLGQTTLHDLQDLVLYLKNLDDKGIIDSSVLVKFSLPSSAETKLLRVLKSIDFLHANDKDSTYSSSQFQDLKSIFESFELCELWTHLSHILTVFYFSKLNNTKLIIQRGNANHVANTMLSLIESFMIISKPSINILNANSNLIKSTVESRTHTYDELFISFTEEHKKLINSLVRSNPSLMGGSFSILIHNPKGNIFTYNLQY